MSTTTIKPVIYYNGRFHFVEEDCASKFHFDTEYAIFQIYNLKVGKQEFAERLSEVTGLAGSVTFLNEFERMYTRHSENRIEIGAGASHETNNSDRLKIKIKFSNKSHENLIEELLTSSKIALMTSNGFSDWVPLDSTSYECILQSSTARHDNNGGKDEMRQSLLRALSDTIDPVLLDVVIDDLLDDFESSAFEKLFPGPIITIFRGQNRVSMTVVLTCSRFSFDEDMGKIFIDILNSLIQDRKIEKTYEKHIYDSFFLLVVRLLNLIRDLVHLNATYEEFYSPGVFPLFTGSIKYLKVKYIESLTDLEKSLIDVGFEKFEDRLQELSMMVREIDQTLEMASINLQTYINNLMAIALPSIYYYNNTFGEAITIFGCMIGCIIFLISAFWSGWLRNNYSKAISLHKKAIPIHSETANSVEALQRWLNRISIVRRCKVPMNNNELKNRKTILYYLFDELVTASAELRLSISIRDELKRYK
ncbi:14071_t:CDS:2 [Entrophospora sp. SA101]|nr:14071_t:CDS:2 [Entrophospora sp. SA101]